MGEVLTTTPETMLAVVENRLRDIRQALSVPPTKQANIDLRDAAVKALEPLYDHCRASDTATRDALVSALISVVWGERDARLARAAIRERAEMAEHHRAAQRAVLKAIMPTRAPKAISLRDEERALLASARPSRVKAARQVAAAMPIETVWALAESIAEEPYLAPVEAFRRAFGDAVPDRAAALSLVRNIDTVIAKCIDAWIQVRPGPGSVNKYVALGALTNSLGLPNVVAKEIQKAEARAGKLAPKFGLK